MKARCLTPDAAILIVFIAGCAPQPPAAIDLDVIPDTLQLFAPGVISTGMYERDIAISPDGDEIIYTLGNHKQTSRRLVSIRRSDAGWGRKEVMPFSGQYHDIEPAFTADGRTLFFASTRPMPGDNSREDYNIWKVDRRGDGWGDPAALGDNINTPGGEYYPSLTRSGDLYFTATRPEGVGKEDIYVSRLEEGVYQKPEVLDSNINTVTYEFNAFISPDEDLLIFGSYGRDDDLGGGDLYVSHRLPDGSWTRAKNMGKPVNSDALDYCPLIDYARGNFYFTSERKIDQSAVTVEDFVRIANLPGNGLGDLYRIGWDALQLQYTNH